MLALVNSVALPHAALPAASAGYTLMAMAFLPLGKFIFAASHTKAFDEAQAKSREELILYFQVQVAFVGLDSGFSTSSAVLNITVLSLSFASFPLFKPSDVSTSSGFNNSPDATTI